MASLHTQQNALLHTASGKRVRVPRHRVRVISPQCAAVDNAAPSGSAPAPQLASALQAARERGAQASNTAREAANAASHAASRALVAQQRLDDATARANQALEAEQQQNRTVSGRLRTRVAFLQKGDPQNPNKPPPALVAADAAAQCQKLAAICFEAADLAEGGAKLVPRANARMSNADTSIVEGAMRMATLELNACSAMAEVRASQAYDAIQSADAAVESALQSALRLDAGSAPLLGEPVPNISAVELEEQVESGAQQKLKKVVGDAEKLASKRVKDARTGSRDWSKSGLGEGMATAFEDFEQEYEDEEGRFERFVKFARVSAYLGAAWAIATLTSKLIPHSSL